MLPQQSKWKLFSLAASIALSTPAPTPTLTATTTVATTHAATVPTAIAIPEKIWYKVGRHGLNNQSREWTESCLKKNPTYKSEYLTDEAGDLYVKEKFSSRPDIVETYLALPIPILKADLLRYLLLYREGGVWSDLDVSCDTLPIAEWIPAKYKNATALVVGWEFDMGWGDNFVRQFATWTVMAKPGSPHLLMVINDIVDGLRDKATKNNIALAEMTLEIAGDVVDATGPRMMTRGITKSLKSTFNKTLDEKDYSRLMEPKLLGDVLVLPGFSFASSSNRYEQKVGPALVTHHYAGSWKNEKGGERRRRRHL
ncbi:hypothetical protein F5884DRAFT_819574 [Xylogone sp. PMI_703]|nr:hypothetical protein F5884DRAFT_819574 [Xylogone sp. PMI_703]